MSFNRIQLYLHQSNLSEQEFTDATSIISGLLSSDFIDWDVVAATLQEQPQSHQVFSVRLLRGLVLVCRNHAPSATSDTSQKMVPIILASLLRFMSYPHGEYTARCLQSYLESLANFRGYIATKHILKDTSTVTSLIEPTPELSNPLVLFLVNALGNGANTEINEQLGDLLHTANSPVMAFLLDRYESVDFKDNHELSVPDRALMELLLRILAHESFRVWMSSFILEDVDTVHFSDNVHPDFTRWLKLAQILITANNWSDEYKLTSLLAWVYGLYELFQKYSLDALTSKRDDERLHLHLTILLDIMSDLCQYEQGKRFFLHYNLVDSLAPLLIKIHTEIPPIGLKDSEKKFRFANVKSIIIEILAYLTLDEFSVQEKIRSLHLMEVILSSCIIDQNNPFMKERAILCLRYLLANNIENQNLVMNLEAKSKVDENVLSEAGYEVEMVDGKLAIKKAKSTTS